MQWWAQPVPFDEARSVWSAYLGAANMPHGPRLEAVLTRDHEARDGKAAAGDMAGRLREVFEAYSARHGSTVVDPSSSAAEGSGLTAGSNMGWEAVQATNTKLDVASPVALQAMFRAASLKEVLAQHWKETASRLLPGSDSEGSSDGSSDGSSGSESSDDEGRKGAGSISSFEDLWALMRQVHEATLMGSRTEGRSDEAVYRLAGFSPAAEAAASSEGAPAAAPTRRPGGAINNASEAWQDYSRGLGAAAAAGGTSSGSVSANPRPYAGARPLLRFRQTFMLGPTASTASTSAVTPGLGSTGDHGSIDTHASNRGVELRVRVSELRHEAGLSPTAMRHMLAVCGKGR